MTKSPHKTTFKDNLKEWRQDGNRRGWVMPRAAWWKRLPVIRHVRGIALAVSVLRHEETYRQLGMIPDGYDDWVLFGIFNGQERPLRKGN